MSRSTVSQIKEHLSGEAHYPFLPACPGRHGPLWRGAQAGGVLLTQAAEVTGLTSALKVGLGRWRKPTATHDPGKILSDLALSLALGGDCLADLALLRTEPGVYGKVASEATVSRTISTLAGEGNATVRAINTARAAARARAWAAADPLIIDLDATVVIAHSEKQFAAPTFKRSFGFHPVRREALSIRAEVRDHRPRSCRSRAVKLRTA